MKIIFVVLIIAIAGCKTKPFIKQSVDFEKVSGDCGTQNGEFRMNSNLNGERYEFQRCLDVDFQKKQLTAIRRGDTIELKFARKNSKQALYNLTVDLDAYPRYNCLLIEGTAIPIKPYEK